MTLKKASLGLGIVMLTLVFAFVAVGSVSAQNSGTLYGTGENGPVTQSADTGTTNTNTTNGNGATTNGTMNNGTTGTGGTGTTNNGTTGTPGLPNTGAGGNAAVAWASILAIVGVGLAGLAFYFNRSRA
jgi:hypothetical protein